MNKKLGFAAAGVLLAAVAAPNLAQAQNAYTTSYVNLRAGPGTDYPVVFPVPANVAVQSYGCLNDWSWCDVTVNGYRGWMNGDYIGYVQEGRWVPVYDYGPRYNVPIISFTFGSYWDNHYRNRPWYSQRSKWERYDHDHRDAHRPPTRRAMPTVLPKIEADKWKNNGNKWDNNRSDNDRRDNNRNDNDNKRGDNDNNKNDNNRFGNDKNDKNDNNRFGNDKNDNDRNKGVVAPKTTVTPQPAPQKNVVTPVAPKPDKQVDTPKATPKVTPAVNQDANKRDDNDRGDKNRGGDNNRSNDKGDKAGGGGNDNKDKDGPGGRR